MATPTPPDAPNPSERPDTSAAAAATVADPTPWPHSSHRSRRRLVLAAATAVLVVALVSWAALAWRPASFDRDLAIDRAVDASGGRLTRSQAGCYVDRVRAALGSQYVEPDAVVSVRIGDRLTAIRDDCVGLAQLGGSAGASGAAVSSTVPVTEGGDQPLRHGDDPVLDRLWSRCAAGDGSACDELFTQSPIGSEYEAFALTCGGRTRELRCAARYPAPGVTATSPTEVP
jgi:hypothetical protein